MTNHYLQTAILRTLSYFDIFNFPLNLIELKKYLFAPSFPQNKNNFTGFLLKTLQNLELEGQIINKQGFYCFKGKTKIVKQRQIKHLRSQKLWKRAKLAAQVLSCLPFVRMIAVCNTLALNNVSQKSDIDLFIIVKDQRIWLTRGLITLIVSLLGLRRHKTKIAGKICLSFYITSQAMNLKKIALRQQKGVEDIYLIYWLASLNVLYYEKQTKEKFFQTNQWIKQNIPLIYPYHPLLYRRQITLGNLSKTIKNLLEGILSCKIGDQLEKLLKYVQLKKMSKNYSSKAKENNTDVIIRDNILKFHEIDRRRKYRKEFLKRLDKYFLDLL